MTIILTLILTLAAAPADTTEILPAYGTLTAGVAAPWLAGWTLEDQVWNLEQADADSTGGRTAVVFWASWCAPCQEGLRRLADAERQLSTARVEVVLVNLDARESTVTRYLEDNPAPFVCVLDPFQQNTRRFFGLQIGAGDSLALPRTVLLDGEGRVEAILGREGADYLEILLGEPIIPSRR